jgi:hypothetical protein
MLGKSARRPARLGRREAARDPRPMILIVCEGECTEPYYLDDLRRTVGLSNVTIRGKECGSDPLSVVTYAVDYHKKFGEFDKIYCVVDRDEHKTFERAVEKVVTLNKKIDINIIDSYPSFEYRYLLHKIYSRKPFVRASGRSPAENLIHELKKEIPNYEKSDRKIFEALRGDLGRAISNSRRALEESVADGERNPSTRMHELVEHLFKLGEVEV